MNLSGRFDRISAFGILFLELEVFISNILLFSKNVAFSGAAYSKVRVFSWRDVKKCVSVDWRRRKPIYFKHPHLESYDLRTTSDWLSLVSNCIADADRYTLRGISVLEAGR
jgi:hypothetical protein